MNDHPISWFGRPLIQKLISPAAGAAAAGFSVASLAGADVLGPPASADVLAVVACLPGLGAA
jgi:hypothetical protein